MWDGGFASFCILYFVFSCKVFRGVLQKRVRVRVRVRAIPYPNLTLTLFMGSLQKIPPYSLLTLGHAAQAGCNMLLGYNLQPLQ